MNVTPFITKDNEVILNIRPTITDILGYINDPNPTLALAGVVSQVPEISVREMESVMRVASGNTAVIGGLMQDSFKEETSQIPFLGDIPLIGDLLFSQKLQRKTKSELVILLKPYVVDDSGYAQEVDAIEERFQPYFPNLNQSPIQQDEEDNEGEGSAEDSSAEAQ